MIFKILNLEPEDYSQKAKKMISDVAQIDDGPLSREDLKKVIGNYHGIIVRLGHKIDQDILSFASNLKVIVSATTGLNHIDCDEAEKSGVEILSLRGEQDFLKTITATAEHTMGLMFGLIRYIGASHNNVIQNHWDRDQFKGQDLAGKTLGIIGYGRLGQLVARYAHAFGMNILACDIQNFESDNYVQFASMDDVLEKSDIISLHVLYTDETHHLIDHSCFQKMKDGAFFINTSRGEIVDEEALLKALQNGSLAGAALDVLSDENSGQSDWMSDNALIEYARKHNNLIITPHIGGATYDSMEKTEIFMAEKLKNFIEAIRV